jgi:GT2 family glycosyltransferase
MQNRISIIIPTYKSPTLELCLTSILTNQSNPNNQIIVVVDGTYEHNKDILNKFENKIHILNLEENVGTCRATNLGVFNAIYENILIINDDNVLCYRFDELLQNNVEDLDNDNWVITPNQIEPFSSIFPQFVIKDFGRTPEEFDEEGFNKFCETFENESILEGGYTFPIFISKNNFLKVGGFDESYPSQSGYVSDWEFFIKCELCGMYFYRDFGINFYHFVSVSAKSDEQREKSKNEEINCHKYFYYKWGFNAFNRALMKK